MDFQLLRHLHLGFAIIFFLSYTIKSLLFLSGKHAAFLTYKKKTLLVETLFALGFLISGFIMVYILIGFDGYQHWLDSKITLALIAIPIGIIGFKKENKLMVTISLVFFIVSLIIGLMHYQ